MRIGCRRLWHCRGGLGKVFVADLRKGGKQAAPVADPCDAKVPQVGIGQVSKDRIIDPFTVEVREQVLPPFRSQNGFELEGDFYCRLSPSFAGECEEFPQQFLGTKLWTHPIEARPFLRKMGFEKNAGIPLDADHPPEVPVRVFF
jgi:hypothetical protein